jgi:hypothetical protein
VARENEGAAAIKNFDERLRVEALQCAEKLKAFGNTLRDAVEFYLPHLEATNRTCTIVHLTQQSERTEREQNWFALTGRVVAVKVEADGDIHIALGDATGDKPRTVVCEVPLKPQWCDVRETVFSWTRTRFPFLPKD